MSVPIFEDVPFNSQYLIYSLSILEATDGDFAIKVKLNFSLNFFIFSVIFVGCFWFNKRNVK